MSEIRKGVVVEMNGEPYQVLEAHHSKKQQRRPVKQTKLKSLVTGKVLDHTFQQSDKIPAAGVEKRSVKFLYRTRDEFFFVDRTGKKYGFLEGDLGDTARWLKKDLAAEILVFRGRPVSVSLPIKVSFLVKDAPPGVKGDTTQGGTKDVTLETDAIVKTPLFVSSGDTVEVNTETGDYVRRIT